MTLNTPVTTTLNNHVTVRHFSGEKIPDEMLLAILNAARRSPTSSNMQTYSIIIVRDQETKKKLAVLAGNQKHVETCDVFIAFCADIFRLEAVCALHGTPLVKNLETTLVSTVDAALVGMSVQTAAESFGLGGVMIGSMRNHPEEAAELLGLPAGVYIVYGMCLGWPDPQRLPPQKPRLPENMIIHFEQYNAQDAVSGLEAYDQALAEHYETLGRNLHEAAWTGPIATRLQHPVRPHLRPSLERLGFSLD